ncbi:MAG: DnaJ domain-containing protein [Deltaproteobacteria bacterium]|nr:DnaJ domain-containing protein [Deltaproteobacteria bacterium]
MEFHPFMFIIIYGVLTLSVIAYLVYFLATRKKDYFNHGIPHNKKPIPKIKEDMGYREKMIDENDPFQVLGVPHKATKNEVLKAYKKKLKMYHPDIVSHRGEEFKKIAQEKTILLQEAKEKILKNLKAA